MNVYVASSWRNVIQPTVVRILRECGHEVYDFRNPPGRTGFSWSSVDKSWQEWTVAQYREALMHPLAASGYKSDLDALNACDACVLVLPSGRSASWELGYAIGKGKEGAVMSLEPFEADLMYRDCKILATIDELMDWGGLPR